MNRMFKKIRFLFLICFVAMWGCTDSTPVAVNIDPTLMPKLTGTNVAGGDVDYTKIPGNGTLVSGTNFLFVSHQDVDYLVSKKMNSIRLLFSWEAMQPTMNGPIATGTDYYSKFNDIVNYATSKNLFVMMEPHGAITDDFAAYRGNKVGSSAVPNAAFASLWKGMANIYKGNARVLYGLSNEPHDMSTLQWYGAAQAAIDGIRSTGSTQTIMVPGNDWSQPFTWNDNWYDTANTKVSNATGWLTLKDPKNNLVVSVHEYFDQNAGGGANDIVSATIMPERLAAVVNWARANGKKVHLSEYGLSSDNPLAKVALANTYNYIDANSDVIVGSFWWAYGPPAWWGGYQFTLCPTNNYLTDNSKMAWISPHFVAPTAAMPTVAPVPTPTPTPTPVADASPPPAVDAAPPPVVDASVSDSGKPVVDAGPSVPTFYSRLSVYNSGTNFQCAYVLVTNTTASAQTWHNVYINMNDVAVNKGKLQAYWFFTSYNNPNTIATSTLKFKPIDRPTLNAKEAAKNVGGFCYDFGPGWKAPVVSGID